MTHPIDPDAEIPGDVFRALVATLPDEEQREWIKRWETAQSVEARRRQYDREWDASLVGVTRFGQ